MPIPDISLAQFNKIATGKAGRADVPQARYTPLSRALVRDILDQYAHYGKGYTEESARNISYDDYQAAWNTTKMSVSNAAKRDAVNLITDSKVDAGNVNRSGSLVNNPYEKLSAKEIGKQLDAKGLNEILDAASNSDSPGQVGFFMQV